MATVLLAGAVLTLVAPGVSIAAKKCYDCHSKEKSLYTSYRFKHEPTTKEDCESCHKRHGFSQQLILQDNTAELCYTCHGDLKDTFASGHVHFPVAEGVCWDCHDPHGSDKPGFLREAPEDFNDPASCLICHRSDLEDQLTGSVSHQPFTDLDCVRCHDPHNSPTDGLLVKDADALCGECHDAGTPELQQAHAEINMGTLSCISCHSGHSSSNKALLSENTHPPFAAGDCAMCHSKPDAGGQVTFEEGSGPNEVCGVCHSDVIEQTELSHPHAVVDATTCLDCHKPHSSRFDHLLVSDQETLCMQCHDDVMADSLKAPHPPALLGQCSSCHEVHGSERTALVKSTDRSLCIDCHQDFVSGADSSRHVHAVIDDCTQCHAPHQGIGSTLLRQTPDRLCADCHDVDKAALSAASGHQPYLTGNCVGCHESHYSENNHLVAATDTSLCLNCHVDIKRRVNLPVPHAPAADDCATCHTPHYSSDQPSLLTSMQKEMCAACHDYADLQMEEAFVHTPAEEGDCSGCHNPHGGSQEKLVTGRMRKINVNGQMVGQLPHLSGKTSDLCYTCHEDLSEKFRKQGAHAPVVEGACDACHASHGSANRGFVLAKALELCEGCHSVDAALAEKHGGYAMAGVDCLTCHDPHVSEQHALVRAMEHPPFAEGDCSTCHEAGPDGGVVLNAEATELCGMCHETVEADAAHSDLHAPFALGECSGCHGVHTADRPKLLRYEGEELCATCHGDVHRERDNAVMHEPFGRGECLSCHKPHSSEAKGLLTASKKDFCFTCHEEIKTELAQGTPHAPVVDGECAACHEPHAGTQPALLTAGKKDLCSGCHDPKSAALTKAHSGFAVADADCQNCHAAHAGEKGRAGLLLPVEHAPFGLGDCQTCHQGTSTDIFIESTSRQLCLGCHDDVSNDLSAAVVHKPMNDPDGCVQCHGAHVGFDPGIQLKNGPNTCLTCHNGAEFTGAVKHAPAFDDCATCHKPHSGDHRSLLETSDIMQLCLTCHENARESHYHPMGIGVIDPRTREPLICTSCHSPHSSEYPTTLVADPDRKLCVVCHAVTH